MTKRKAPGILPCKNWLVNNGYAGLSTVMWNHPEAFAHIKQISKKGKTIEQWMPIAEKLEKRYGQLPTCSWLIEHNYRGLVTMIFRYPESFAHIKQASKKGKTIKEWLVIAEMLEKEHKILPNPKWLVKNNYSGLYFAMQKFPKKFSHIKQNRIRQPRKIHSLEEYYTIAKRLERKYGELPRCNQLYSLGYGGLYQAMQDYPDYFRDIKRKEKGLRPSERKTPQERHKEAKHLAKENGGILPSRAELFNSGHGAIWHALTKYPKLFSDIKTSESIHRSRAVRKWLPIAEILASENDDVLPSDKWLKKHGYSRICETIKSHPQPFAHIPRTK